MLSLVHAPMQGAPEHEPDTLEGTGPGFGILSCLRRATQYHSSANTNGSMQPIPRPRIGLRAPALTETLVNSGMNVGSSVPAGGS